MLAVSGAHGLVEPPRDRYVWANAGAGAAVDCFEGLLFRLPGDAAAPDLAALAATPMPGEERRYSFGRHDDLEAHIHMLAVEFAGASQLAFYHAVLIVLLRRGIETERTFQRFLDAWKEQGGTLLRELDSRWLVSACDTIVDFSTDDFERAIAVSATQTINTIKLYETERLNASASPVPPIEGRVPLFDGMSAFVVGQGDMIFNLRKRTAAVCARGGVACSILMELLRRVDENETIYKRLADAHKNPETAWRKKR